MDIIRSYGTRTLAKKELAFGILAFGCIGINILGKTVATRCGWPVYLDATGTILATILGGYIPGIVVGLASAFINSVLTDPQSVSYGMIHVFIALLTGWTYEKGWWKKPLKFILTLILLAGLGGVLGAFLSLTLYGFGAGYTTSDLVKFFYERAGLSFTGAEIVADYIIDLLDKTISVVVAVAITTIIPKKLRGKFKIHAWMQAPLTSETVRRIKRNKIRSVSLRTKIIVALTLVSSLIAFSSIIISYVLYRQSISEVAVSAGYGIPIKEMNAKSISFLVNQISLFIGLFILILAVFLYFAEYHIILPLNTMAYTASKFSDEREEESFKVIADIFSRLLIHTGDETENLYRVFSNMTQDNVSYLEDIQQKNTTILEMQNALIIVLADMVESRDRSTGDHVKKTAEYVGLIMDEMLMEGVYEEELTSTFISDVYQSAPLHDIGKISVSDVILNKPDKLNDEEFEKMKKHTLAGAQIIDKVIATIPESTGSYLYEARNLALYHHEKWNGTGYPYGVAGEDIPLSARIMAVADVFDALVSERSYKKAFPFDKAISIISESSGEHFDPLVVKAFLNAKDRVRIVSEE